MFNNFNNLKSKIIIPVILILVLLMAVTITLVSITITELVDTLSEERIYGASQAVVAHLNSLEAYSQLTANSTALSVTLIESIQSDDREEMHRYLNKRKQFLNIDSFVVTDQYGVVLLRMHEPDRYGDSGAGFAGIAAAMRGESVTVYVSVYPMLMAMSSVTPVFDDEGKQIGTIAAIFDMSSDQFVDSIAEIFNAAVTIFMGDTSVASTVLMPGGVANERAVGTQVRSDIAESVLGRGETIMLDLNILGVLPHTAFYHPLFGRPGEAVGMFFIGFPNEYTIAATASLQRNVVLIGTIVLSTSAIAMFFLLFRLLKPLEKLTESVSQIGDSDVQLEGKAIYGGDRGDEIGDLSRTIQRMWHKLSEQTEQAQEASLAKSRFLSNMSHEIRTPLNAITGMVAIGMSTPESDKKDYALDKIRSASAHLLGIVNDILDMSKIEANKLELSLVEFNFEKLAGNVVDIIRFWVDEKKQKLTVNIDPNIPDLLIGDDQRVAQVMTNLLSNAIKFTPEKGSINLDINYLGVKGEGHVVQVDVTDTGIGISEEQKERLFGSFIQAENSTSRKYGGTGLGLSITKRILQLMDGEIWIESEIGQGAKFSFVISFALGQGDIGSQGDKSDQEEEVSAISFEGRQILLCEDIEINREIVMGLLESTGITIYCAENGKEAVDMFVAHPERYELIIMDVQMPEMDGIEATRLIRNLEVPRAKDVVIIAMTANVFKDDIEKCIKAGMNDHIGKPIEYDDMIEKLQRYL